MNSNALRNTESLLKAPVSSLEIMLNSSFLLEKRSCVVKSTKLVDREVDRKRSDCFLVEIGKEEGWKTWIFENN